MMSSPVRALEDLAAEDRQAALDFVTEAFAEAILAGVESDCFAHAALIAALQELVVRHGEEPVARFAEQLPKRVRHGEFSVGLKH